MLLAFCLLWVGIQLNAPVWFYSLVGVYILIKSFILAQAFSKAINRSDKEDKE